MNDVNNLDCYSQDENREINDILTVGQKMLSIIVWAHIINKTALKEMKLLSPCELTACVTAVANALACRLNDDELAVLSAVFVQLGDTLASIAAQKAICEKAEH